MTDSIKPDQVSIAERAFELADGGVCVTVGDIRNALSHEGYDFVRHHLASPTLAKQLRQAIAKTRLA